MNTRKSRKTKISAIAGATLLTLTALVAAGSYFFVHNYRPAKEQTINYRATTNRAAIAQQLEGIDRESIRALAPLIDEKTIAELQEAVSRGELSYANIMAYYLDRIDTLDQAEGGLNSIATINPHAMEQARAADTNPPTQPKALYGLGVVVKDNINAADMPTTAGTVALAEHAPGDAPIITHLKDEGAILIGKANLSEWAHYVSFRMPSGYSSYSGQTFNPYGPGEISPLGSSSGSAVAVTANYAPLAIGTETTGSIVAPSAINGVVGIKPTHGHLNGDGIIPLAPSLDTAGPIARTVTDATHLLNAANPTAAVPLPTDTRALAGKRIGISTSGDSDQVNTLRRALTDAGAEVVEISLDTKNIDNTTIINTEFGPAYSAYAATYNAPYRSLADIVTFNEEDTERRARYGMKLLEKAAEKTTTTSEDDTTVQRMLDTARLRLEEALDHNNLDAIAYLDNEEALIACTAGAPEVTVPLLVGDDNTPHGATIITRPGADADAIAYAYALEQNTHARRTPTTFIRQQ